MPRCLPDGKTCRSGPGFVLERSELALRVAKMASDWAIVENSLAMIYGFLMGHYLPRHPLAMPKMHPVANQIFEYLPALKQRLDLIGALSDWLLSAEQYATWRPVRRKTVTGQSARNRIVHAVRGICDDYPDALIRMPVFGKREIYDLDQFAREEQAVTDAAESLTRFLLMIYESGLITEKNARLSLDG